MNKRTLSGFVLILAGVFLFVARGNVMEPGKVFGYFWPSLFVIPLGVLFHWMYFYATNRRGAGLLIPGGILLVGGAVCQVSMLYGIWSYTWPGFLLAVAFGLLEFYWFGGRNRWILVPVFILGSAAVLFFIVFTLGSIISFSSFNQTAAAIILIAAGLFFMLGNRQKKV